MKLQALDLVIIVAYLVTMVVIRVAQSFLRMAPQPQLVGPDGRRQ
jgi:hypothetical protein